MSTAPKDKWKSKLPTSKSFISCAIFLITCFLITCSQIDLIFCIPYDTFFFCFNAQIYVERKQKSNCSETVFAVLINAAHDQRDPNT